MVLFLCFFGFSLFAADVFGVLCFSLETHPASVVAAPLAGKAIFTVVLFGAGLIRYIYFAYYSRYSNKCHYYSEQFTAVVFSQAPTAADEWIYDTPQILFVNTRPKNTVNNADEKHWTKAQGVLY
jgi:hypothetical protein